MLRVVACALTIVGISTGWCAGQTTCSEALSFQRDEKAGQLRVVAGDRELFVYNYAPALDLPHFHPLNTPSGRNLLVKRTEPYPHHRAFWVGDTIERDGVKGDTYNAYYTGVKTDKTYEPPFDTAVRHDSFTFLPAESTTGTTIRYRETLTWETSRTQTAWPLLREHRDVIIHSLCDGDYLIDFSFELRAEFGDVRFISDETHYAWPYLRINHEFSGENGGVITTDSGITGQDATNMQRAPWIDYSNNLDGKAEGITIFQWPDTEPRKWLTRKYGTFGPRRPDSQSGKPFTLPEGETLTQRVGIYVHRGSVDIDRVGEIYKRYTGGRLP